MNTPIIHHISDTPPQFPCWLYFPREKSGSYWALYDEEPRNPAFYGWTVCTHWCHSDTRPTVTPKETHHCDDCAPEFGCWNGREAVCRKKPLFPAPAAPAPTPETDAATYMSMRRNHVPADFARKLERERDEAQAERDDEINWAQTYRTERDNANARAEAAEQQLAERLAEIDCWRDSNNRLRDEMQHQAERAGEFEHQVRTLREALEKIANMRWGDCGALDIARQALAATAPKENKP